MFRNVIALACCLIGLMLVGCGESGPKVAPRYPVKGNVKLDNQPMPEGEIIFTAPDQPAISIPIANGTYSGQANEGKNKIQIVAHKDDPKSATKPAPKINYIPAKYNTNSNLSADVSKSGGEFSFEVTSR